MLRIPAMDCPSEENDIRRALADIDGIRSLSFQLSARTLSIDAPDSILPAAVEAIRQAGYEAKILTAGREASEGGSVKAALWKAVLALALATGAELVHFIAPDTLPFRILGMVVAAIAIGLAGLSTYTKGLAALRRGQLNMNALMGVAVTGAFLIGQWPEAAMVMALYAIAELIEARSVDRARNAIKSLLDLTPDTAEVQQTDGVWREVPAGQVVLDACVRVKPGARIPLDGRVTRDRARLIKPRSRARASRWTRPRATWCLPARSTKPARSNSGSRRYPPIPRWPGSSMPWSKPKEQRHRLSASSIALPIFIRRRYSRSPSR
jgi:Cd2+/Zn2+-exporting ATPase